MRSFKFRVPMESGGHAPSEQLLVDRLAHNMWERRYRAQDIVGLLILHANAAEATILVITDAQERPRVTDAMRREATAGPNDRLSKAITAITTTEWQGFDNSSGDHANALVVKRAAIDELFEAHIESIKIDSKWATAPQSMAEKVAIKNELDAIASQRVNVSPYAEHVLLGEAMRCLKACVDYDSVDQPKTRAVLASLRAFLNNPPAEKSPIDRATLALLGDIAGTLKAEVDRHRHVPGASTRERLTNVVNAIDKHVATKDWVKETIEVRVDSDYRDQAKALADNAAKQIEALGKNLEQGFRAELARLVKGLPMRERSQEEAQVLWLLAEARLGLIGGATSLPKSQLAVQIADYLGWKKGSINETPIPPAAVELYSAALAIVNDPVRTLIEKAATSVTINTQWNRLKQAVATYTESNGVWLIPPQTEIGTLGDVLAQATTRWADFEPMNAAIVAMLEFIEKGGFGEAAKRTPPKAATT